MAPPTAIATRATRTTPMVLDAATRPDSAPTTAAAGRVNTHARTIRPATPQRTSDSRLPTPEPMTEPEATCVVDSAYPRWEEARMTAAALDSAAKPCGATTSVILWPTVWMMRQPPR